MQKVNIFKKVWIARIPDYAKNQDAGLDLRSTQETIIYPGDRAAIKTGLIWEPKKVRNRKVFMKIEGKSGLAIKHGIDVMGGIIDEEYRGEIKVILINHGEEPFHIEIGTKVAQGIIYNIPQVKIIEVREVSTTERGDSGFGSTGR